MYSSTNDLLVLGRAILKTTLLSPAQTRRWMKPVTHTSSITASVGAPWEIFRVPTKRGVIDLYTKRGDLGVYAGIIVLCPDYDIGFTILSAAARESIADASVTVLADIITQTFLPAVEAAAKDNAASTFAGTYKATNAINSSITFIVDGGPDSIQPICSLSTHKEASLTKWRFEQYSRFFRRKSTLARSLRTVPLGT
jgi:hypothetical protein